MEGRGEGWRGDGEAVGTPGERRASARRFEGTKAAPSTTKAPQASKIVKRSFQGSRPEIKTQSSRVIVAVYACGVDVEKGPIRQQLWNAPPCDNVESWFGAQSRMIPDLVLGEVFGRFITVVGDLFFWITVQKLVETEGPFETFQPCYIIACVEPLYPSPEEQRKDTCACSHHHYSRTYTCSIRPPCARGCPGADLHSHQEPIRTKPPRLTLHQHSGIFQCPNRKASSSDAVIRSVGPLTPLLSVAPVVRLPSSMVYLYLLEYHLDLPLFLAVPQPVKVDRITEDSSKQRMTEVRDEYVADGLTNMQPHCEDLISRLTDAIRGLAVPRAEEALISTFDGCHATSSLLPNSHLQRSTPASISHFKQ
ncbi:hypothetical protein LAZ67_2002719 [Cordylochernes scorpioides]|uniref:Uncharacterized protein n=1 Tax=Cordylochernes scorpioides TaxID=51811 RepID=A0ABY6K339_9ARAC|nr:hypothetical protein LAZ67_2002719 [Cordylochernes scorpioides]